MYLCIMNSMKHNTDNTTAMHNVAYNTRLLLIIIHKQMINNIIYTFIFSLHSDNTTED